MMARRILIIDDDVHICDGLKARLEFMGYDVSVAHDGRTGLALLGLATVPDPIDGVLLDVHMPVMEGVEVLREIRAKHPKVPVIMMSGGPDRRVFEEAIHMGARDYLMKPFDLTVLTRVCEQVFPLR
jgi:two-component system, NtrC family, response regulator AtoC